MKINLSNPCSIWISTWGITILLMSLQLTGNIVDFNFKALLLVCLNILSAAILYIFTHSNKIKPINSSLEFKEIYKFLKFLLIFWALGSIIDIFYSGGLPIMWATVNLDKDYTDFGIPSFHGVVNACYLFSVTIISAGIFYGGKKNILLLCILLCWPILMLGRGILLSALVQIGAVYLIYNPIGVKRLIQILIGLFFCIVIFGVLGDYRGTANPFEYLLVDQSSIEIFDTLPNGFLWFYIYVTTGLNNITYSIDLINPNYSLNYSVINLLPSFLRFNTNNYELNASLVKLVDQNLNTSTFYSGYISDFGFFGAFLAGVLLQLLAVFAYKKARKGNLVAILAYAILFECIVFSIFYDMFLLLPYLLQLLMALYLMWRVNFVKQG